MVTFSRRRGRLKQAWEDIVCSLPLAFLPASLHPGVTLDLCSRRSPPLPALPSNPAYPHFFAFQEQDSDLWAPGGDRTGRLSVLLPGHGCGSPNVPAQVSVPSEGPPAGSQALDPRKQLPMLLTLLFPSGSLGGSAPSPIVSLSSSTMRSGS